MKAFVRSNMIEMCDMQIGQTGVIVRVDTTKWPPHWTGKRVKMKGVGYYKDIEEDDGGYWSIGEGIWVKVAT